MYVTLGDEIMRPEESITLDADDILRTEENIALYGDDCNGIRFTQTCYYRGYISSCPNYNVYFLKSLCYLKNC